MMNKEKKNRQNEELSQEWDFSEGFGGISQDLSLTQNLGCASDGRKKKIAVQWKQADEGKKEE